MRQDQTKQMSCIHKPKDYLSPRPPLLVPLASWQLAPKLQAVVSTLPEVEADVDIVLYILALCESSDFNPGLMATERQLLIRALVVTLMRPLERRFLSLTLLRRQLLRLSPIWSVGGGGSAGSIGETPRVSEDVVVGHRSPIGTTGRGGEVSVTTKRVGIALISEPVSVVPVPHNPRSISHINLPLPTIRDLLFSGSGAGDLNLLRDVLRDLPHLFLERALAAREDLRVKEYLFPVTQLLPRVLTLSGSVAEPVAPIEGRAVEAVVPDSDEGSSCNSLVGQHVLTSGVDDCRVTVSEASFPFRIVLERWFLGRGGGVLLVNAALLDINVEFVEPFGELVSSCSVQLQKALCPLMQKHLKSAFSFFQDGLIESLDDLNDLDDFDYLLDLCSLLE
ncbi:hypothetical protein ACLOJK_036690 [Asimina triloba]